MSPKLDKYLCKTYPKIFAKRNASMKETCMCWGFECGDGWFWLLDNLCKALQSHVDNCHPQPPQIVAEQVKEKYGTLRFYVSGGDLTHSGMIDFAERLSGEICEECGSTKNVGCTSGWVSVRCEECAKKHDMVNWKSNADWAKARKRRLAKEAKAKAEFKKRPHPFPKRENVK